MPRTLVFLLLIAVAAPAAAQVEHCVDQQVMGGTDTPAPLITDWQWAQTFTCEAGGTLSRLEVRYTTSNTPDGVMRLELRSTVDEIPDSGAAALLASAEIPIAGAPGVQTASLDLTDADLFVYPGDLLAAVLVATTPGYDVFSSAKWVGDTEGDYAGGRALYKASPLDWVPQDAVDLDFASYLDCATPAESTTWSAVKSLFSR